MLAVRTTAISRRAAALWLACGGLAAPGAGCSSPPADPARTSSTVEERRGPAAGPSLSPGACPEGYPRVDLDSVAELESASRGIGRFESDPPSTCYRIRNGEYAQGRDLLLYVRKGGLPGSRRLFVGESREGVVIRGRATLDEGAAHVEIRDLTLDVGGLVQDGSFSTVTLDGARDVVLDRLTLTGDCRTGRRGAHVEAGGVDGLLVASSTIEKFGRCGPDGHEDHGIYLASGRDIAIRDNVIRANASRGIQLYTGEGEYGTLSGVTIEGNRIHDNGHADYEDGIVVNGRDVGTIEDLLVRGNLIYRNFYSGIRFAGGATRGIRVVQNTFVGNGARSSHGSRSEINVDGPGMAAGGLVERNIFAVGHQLVNNCRDASKLGFSIRDNVVSGRVAPWFRGGCVSEVVVRDAAVAASDDFRPADPALDGYGASARR
jgi:hypothetical protein